MLLSDVELHRQTDCIHFAPDPCIWTVQLPQIRARETEVRRDTMESHGRVMTVTQLYDANHG